MAGVVFLALELVLATLIPGGSPWASPRMIASIILGRGVLHAPATFEAGIMVAALVVHFVLAIVFEKSDLVSVANQNRSNIGQIIFALRIGRFQPVERRKQRLNFVTVDSDIDLFDCKFVGAGITMLNNLG